MKMTKNRSHYNDFQTVELHSFDGHGDFNMSRAVHALLKYGYFTLYRLKTKTITSRDGKKSAVLVAILKRAETFAKQYESFKVES